MTAPAAAVEVTTMTVTPRPATFPEDYVGETEAINAVEIRPRVGGDLLQPLLNPQRDVQRCANTIALARYRVGYASYFNVIDADRAASMSCFAAGFRLLIRAVAHGVDRHPH